MDTNKFRKVLKESNQKVLISERGGFENMSDDDFKRFRDNLKSDEAKAKADKAFKKSRSATPRPTGKGPQLPKVPKPSGLNTPKPTGSPAAHSKFVQNLDKYSGTSTRAVKGLKKPSILGGIFKAAKKNKKLAIPLALAGGVYALTKGKKKSVSEEMMTTGSTADKPGFSNAADDKGPTAGRDPLISAKPQKRKRLYKKIIGLGPGSRNRWKPKNETV